MVLPANAYFMIRTKVHGVLDYIVGVALVAAPYLFGFSEYGGAAVTVPTVLGIGLILYSLLTQYELGIFRVIPMKAHLTLDFIAAAVLAVSPWLFGFSDLPANVWVPHLVVGLAVLLVVWMSTSASPVEEQIHRRAHMHM